MKYSQITLLFLMLMFFTVQSQPNPMSAFTHKKVRNHETFAENSIEAIDFYGNNNGAMHLLISNEYVGTSFSYFPRTENRLQYGLNVGIIPMSKSNSSSDYYLREDNNKLLLIPFLLSIKIHLRTGYDDRLIPYVIGGFGPILGLDFGSYNRFFDSMTHFNGALGGGGYAGLGLDYLWAEDWAFSMEVRYNLFAFDHPIGNNREFSGFSFFVGFARAFGL
jgi:hypothetical protein